jgi:hypothetical protein
MLGEVFGRVCDTCSWSDSLLISGEIGYRSFLSSFMPSNAVLLLIYLLLFS